jgi:hypothetical protein
MAGNLYELSVRLNDMGGSNQLVYTAFSLALWVYRWWHLIQHKAQVIVETMQEMADAQEISHERGCKCEFCQTMEREASTFLRLRMIPYLTSLTYDDIGERKLEVNRRRPVGQYVSTRQLFEPGYDAWQNEKPFQFTKDNEQLFNDHLQICSICIRKELFYLMGAIQTMNLVRHRPMFQSLRAVLRDAHDAFPVRRDEEGDVKSLKILQSESHSPREGKIPLTVCTNSHSKRAGFSTRRDLKPTLTR